MTLIYNHHIKNGIRHMSIHFINRIKEACDLHPGKTAIVSGSESVTCYELWRISEQLACYMEENTPEGKPVIVYGSKSPYMLISFLACSKAGRAYCPIDASLPASRLQDIIEMIESPAVIATEEFPLPANVIMTKSMLSEMAHTGEGLSSPEASISSDSWVSGDDTVYIIFTSGSTGRPKGVEISSDNLCNFVSWVASLFPEDLPILNQAAFSFDLSVMDIYAALTLGRTLCCMDKTLQQDIAAAVRFIKAKDIGYIVSTPSFVNTLLSEPSFCADNVSGLKGFRFCGERLTEQTASKLLVRFPEASIVNTYGPTESTVCVTGVSVTREMLESEDGISIGTAKPGTTVTFDNGEIIISGDTVGKGYYKDPERTKESFFINEAGERSYRTGDLGYEKGGLLYFKGRADSQIKLNGYRIELQDIEANLCELEGVKEAVVLCKKSGDAVRYLTAVVVPADHERELLETSGALHVSREIKRRLSERLPSYMIPKRILFIERMPLNGNSKIDRRKLEGLI